MLEHVLSASAYTLPEHAPNPHISNYLKTSGRRISESCCVAITFERFEERPDADRV
jgi:hypothetical protein